MAAGWQRMGQNSRPFYGGRHGAVDRVASAWWLQSSPAGVGGKKKGTEIRQALNRDSDASRRGVSSPLELAMAVVMMCGRERQMVVEGIAPPVTRHTSAG